MSLLDNYVAAVKRHLPAQSREDIGDELRSSLADSLDALEESTGRPLSDDDVAAVLKRRGHPLLVAGAYRGDRGLVGPAIYPIYVQVLKVGLAIIAGVVLARYLFGIGVEGASAQPRDVLHLGYWIYWALLALFTWVTVIFHAAESWMERTRFLQRWEPTGLRRVDEFAARIPARNPLADIVVLVLLMSVLYSGVNLPGRLLKLATPIAMQVGPMWQAWLVPAMIGLAAIAIGIAVANLVQGYWHRRMLAVSFVVNVVLGLALSVVVLDPDGIVLDVAGALVDRGELASIVLTAKVLLGVVAVLRLVQAARQFAWLRGKVSEAGGATASAAAP